MEFPSFSNRYVPHRPLPPLSSDHHRHHRDILHRDTHHVPPPPFHPPPPPPPLYPPLPPAPPPPPPFNPHQSNFTFLSHHHSPPRVSNSSNRTLFRVPELDNPYPPPRPDSWPDLSRVSPYRPTSNYNPDFELNSRSSFRDEFPYRENRNDNHNQSQRLFWDRIDDDIDNDSDNYRYRFASDSHNSNFTREIRENYESRYGSVLENERFLNDNRNEDRSWGSMDMEHNDEFVSTRRELDIYDSSRFSNRDRDREREERDDFFRTPPKKQIQKRSVLLRIGKPNDVRNSRSHEQHFGSFRGKEKDKDPIVYLSQRLEEKREQSPVDLDVSFKSNALVAKAIAAANSSPAWCFTPRNRKVRKVTMSDSPYKKFAEFSVKSGNSIHESDFPSTSEKTPKKVENVTVSGNGSVVNDSAGSSAVKVSLGDTASDEGHKRGGSSEAPSYRIRKKKKVASLSSPASNLKSAKKDSGPVTVDSSMNTLPASDQGVMHLEEQMTSTVLAIKHDDFVSLPSGNVPTANKDESPAAIASEMDNSEINCRRSLLLDFNRNSSTHLLGSLNPPETEIDEGTENVRGSVNTFISYSDMVQAEFQAGSTVSGIGGVDEVGQQSSQNGKSILHENGIEGSLEVMVVGIGNGNASLSTPQENKIHEGQVDLHMAVQDAHNTSDSVFGFQKQENITVYNIDVMDAGPKESSVNEATNLLHCGNEEAYLNAADNCIGGLGNLDLSKKEETTIHEGTMNANSSYYARSSPSNSDFTNCQGREVVSNTCILDDTSNQACLDGATMIHENTVIEEYQKAEVLTRDYAEVCSEKDYTVKRKRNVGDIQLDLSSPSTCDTHLDVVSSALDENATLSFSVMDLVPAELKDDSCGTGNLHDTFQSCKDGVSVVHGSRLIESSNEVGPLVKDSNNGDSNGACPVYNKKRKVFSPDEKTVSEDVSSLAPNSSLDNFKVKMKSDQALVDDLSVNTKSASSSSQGTQKSIQSLNPVKRDLNLTRKQQTSAIPRVFTGPSSVQLNTSKRATPSKHNAKSRTWHRTDSTIASVAVKKTIPNPVHAQRLLPRKVGKVQSSYIRKGNSLVRKPAPVSALPHVSHASCSSVYQLNPSARDDIKKSSGPENKKFTGDSANWLRTRGRDEIKKSSGSESRVGIDSSASCLRTGGSAAAPEMPETSPLPNITKSLDCATTLAGDFTASLLANTPSDGCSEATSVPLELTTNVDIPTISEDAPKSSGTSEYQIGLINDLGSQRVLDNGNSVKKITYVKRKSNQLIATSNANDMFGQDLDKTQASSSDNYYKRRKNQLVRASLESDTMPRVILPDNTLSSEAQRISRVIASRSLSKRQLATTKMHKPSKFSLVWRLSNSQSPKKDAISLQRQKELSHLFPWKRATYSQSSMHDSVYNSNNNSLSLISRKLLLTRKRDTIYTRSKRGFSLRISKLLSVGGSSLKWSKSIEKNSKRANEEATLAVAAVQKKKREQINAPCAVSGTKSRNCFSRKSVHSSKLRPGERVFRIGSVRYKMDPTRKTLQRISEEEASCLSILESEKNVTKSYVPRRLLIGNNEYVRIGNGNQLIRDPKKRTRTLASEKVRWSLHTARLRLARKSKYCQFFTRFGKCNKDDGKCPYIHDPAKIAVCTKFLNGSCSNPNCELTHKVIPERMQDCSYYLQGLCSNGNCPYRHVNVNANASICEGFLKGYCADGNECRKKHTYVCPTFEATGICPQGSKCKLHHPKKRSKGMKRKSIRDQKNAQGRYFGSKHVDTVKSRTAVSEKLHLKKDDDIFCQEGKFSDYISLDINDEEAGKTMETSSSEQITMCDSNPTNLQVTDLDELIQPIRIMYKSPITESSPAVGIVGERAGSYISEESNCCEVRT